LELPFDSSEGPSFTNLVRRHSGDMAARAMLDELIRVRAVEQLPTGSFKVLTRAYIPESLHPDSLQRFGEVVRDFVATVVHNMEKKRPLRFERIIFADDGLREDLMAAFDALIRTKCHNLLIELDNWLSAQAISPTARHRNVRRVHTGVGIYHFVGEHEIEGPITQLPRQRHRSTT
jgi:hypothetical protein